MVGLPWGQFHGAWRSLRLSSTLRIVLASSAFPIMMLERHARMASMARTLDGRTISDTDEPDPREPPVERRESPTVSCDLAGNAYSPWSSMPISSCTSSAPKVMPLLKGTG